MSQEEYYKILKDAWEKVNKNNLEEIRKYNEMKRQLRKLLDN